MTIKVPILDLQAQYRQVGATMEQQVIEVLRSGQYILSDKVVEFENAMASVCGTTYGVGVANGTDALTLSLWALDIGPGDEVITTPFTFAATVEAILLRGATPVFVDIDETTFNIDPAQIADKVTSRTKAILPVHLYGLPADMPAIMEIANKYGLRVIEDNAQAIGAQCNGSPTGSFADMGSISFYPTKNLGACGDAGMIVTKDEKLAHRLRCLRAHGMNRRYYHDELGVNSRLDAIQAVALLTKLNYLKEWNDRRDRIAQQYTAKLSNCPGLIAPKMTDSRMKHVWHQYTIRVQSNTPSSQTNEMREWLSEQLKEREIGTMCYYPIPLHLQTGYQSLGYKQGDFPKTERLSLEVLSIPMYPELTDEQIEHVTVSIVDLMSQRVAPASVHVTPFVGT